jgi:hypothetical protein
MKIMMVRMMTMMKILDDDDGDDDRNNDDDHHDDHDVRNDQEDDNDEDDDDIKQNDFDKKSYKLRAGLQHARWLATRALACRLILHLIRLCFFVLCALSMQNLTNQQKWQGFK